MHVGLGTNLVRGHSDHIHIPYTAYCLALFFTHRRRGRFMAASHITHCGPEAPTLWSEYVALGGGFSRLLAISSQKPVGGKTLWTSRSKHPSTPQIACLNALKQTETFSHPEAGHPMTRRSAWDSAAHAYKASLPVGLPRIVLPPGTTISALVLTYVTHLDPYRCLV